ncbi:glutamine amidotransferase [Candidatus Laterigemmans baculatus]|uniref:glutamine amidotransferase n=1 Tax=Candidatus Laterigemmans baculatus TaxID=2770505 RepID=UPI0013DC28F5|nr:glutamine amidotransferase [Candidatus Laterigemmans baculatus]
MTSLALEPIFDSLLVVVAIALLGAGALGAIRPSGGELTPRRARVLLGVRAAALGLLLLALLRPAIVRTDSRPAAATLAVLIDQSRSMTLPDGEGQPRWQTQSEVIEQLRPALESLDEQLEIRYFAYGDAVQPLDPGSLDAVLAADPTRPQTDLGAALRAGLASASGRPLAGVVFSGDGTSTVSDSNPSSVARTLASLEVPLWSVPIGPRVDASESRDVAVEELPETYQLFSKNLFRITAAVRSRGMAGRDLPVRITLINDQGQREELATRSLAPSTADEVLPLDVELAAPPAGQYRLEVVAESQPGETLTDNNSQTAFLDVREGGGRVLYVEGERRFEHTFLRRAISESPDLELDDLLIDRATQPRWPIDVGDATQPGRYDVFILGDLDATALGKETLEAIAERVNAGSGLLMIGGLHTFDAGGYANSPLAPVLPIPLDAAMRTPLDAEPPARAMLEGEVPLRVARPHPITRLTQSENNAEVWEELKPLRGANRFDDPKIAPGVEVLLESPEEDPLLVVGAYGGGRTAVFAGDSTWQWWGQGRSDVHRRFWRQLLLWLLARDNLEEDEVWIRMEARRFDRAAPASFTAGIHSLDPAAGESRLAAEIIGDDARQAVPLVVQSAASGAQSSSGASRAADEPLVSGQIPDLPGGFYTLRVFDSREASTIAAAEMQFQVVDVDAELSRPLAEVAQMEQLAALTRSAGGRTFRPDEVDDLIETITALRQQTVLPVVEKYRLGDDPLSGWVLLLAFVGLMSSEWYLRKRWGLS